MYLLFKIIKILMNNKAYNKHNNKLNPPITINNNNLIILNNNNNIQIHKFINFKP